MNFSPKRKVGHGKTDSKFTSPFPMIADIHNEYPNLSKSHIESYNLEEKFCQRIEDGGFSTFSLPF